MRMIEAERELRRLAANVVGFRDLAERGPSTVKRIQYEAQAAGSGYALALAVWRYLEELSPPDHSGSA